MDFFAAAPEALLCGFVVGLLICFTGVGGGVLVIPAVAFFFDQTPSAAVGTAAVYAAAAKTMAGMEHARIRNINYKLFARVAIAAAPGALVAAAAVNATLAFRPDFHATLQETLRVAVIAAILMSLWFACRKTNDRKTDDGNGGKSGEALSQDSRQAKKRTVPLACGSFAVGVAMGLTGVGGGVLIVPLLMAFSGESPKRIVGASILIALALSALSAAVYAGGGQVNWELALWMSAGSLVATPVGSRLLRRASEEVVRRSLIALILVAAGLMAAGG